jgi:ATP-dependent RNA helicase DeaD
MKSEAFRLSKPMISLLEKEGITIATPIQKEIIPAIFSGRDILAQSETGSGKTISFAVPIIELSNRKDGLIALILVPTRELCIQITSEFVKFSQINHLGISAVYGGVSVNDQIRKIKTTNIIIATPGRLIDLLERNSINLKKIKFLVFDEADRMLDMGFIPDIERILKYVSEKRQTMLFSATVSKEVASLSKRFLYNPVRVSLDSAVKPEFLHQTYYQTTTERKIPLLIHLLKKERDLALVFCNRKHITDKLAKNLRAQGINAKCLHGDMSQSQRERVTGEFRHKKINVLIATDVASRGLHIEDISHVYNYEIPKDVDSYTHRVGRTARAGKKGEAISLVSNGEDQKFFKQILFTYSGSITLKTINPDNLMKIEVKKTDTRKNSKEPQNKLHKSSNYHSKFKQDFRKDDKPGKSIKSNEISRSGNEQRNDRKENSRPWIKRKHKSHGNNNPGSWDEKKPKFWSEKKAKTWRDKLVKMEGK